MGTCCAQCFDDTEIRRFIRSRQTRGSCDYCRSKRVLCADTMDVGEFVIAGLQRAYERVEDAECSYNHDSREYVSGDSARDILMFTEAIFSTKLDTEGCIESLVRDLLHDSLSHDYDDMNWIENEYTDLLVKDRYSADEFSSHATSWSAFKHQVRHCSRFFDLGRASRSGNLRAIDRLLRGARIQVAVGTRMHRARAAHLQLPVQASELGPPPYYNACRSGRMSPPGIPYFYCANDQSTAVLEVRAQAGSPVTIGVFATVRALTILDLSSSRPQGYGSIFDKAYDHDLRFADHFLRDFIAEISQPVAENVADLEYVATQVLTEYFRSKGVDGIQYKSAVQPTGINWTLFCGPEPPEPDTYVTQLEWLPIFTDWLELVDQVTVFAP